MTKTKMTLAKVYGEHRKDEVLYAVDDWDWDYEEQPYRNTYWFNTYTEALIEARKQRKESPDHEIRIMTVTGFEYENGALKSCWKRLADEAEA